MWPLLTHYLTFGTLLILEKLTGCQFSTTSLIITTSSVERTSTKCGCCHYDKVTILKDAVIQMMNHLSEAAMSIGMNTILISKEDVWQGTIPIGFEW